MMYYHKPISITVHCWPSYICIFKVILLSVDNLSIYSNFTSLSFFVSDSIKFSSDTPSENISFGRTNKHSFSHPHFSLNTLISKELSCKMSSFSIRSCHTKYIFIIIWFGTLLSNYFCRESEWLSEKFNTPGKSESLTNFS